MKGLTLMYLSLLLLFLIWGVGLSAAAETITLEDETEIKYAVAVDEAIDRLSQKVMSCIEKNDGKTEGCICVDECSCKFKDEYILVKKVYQRAIKTYPHWEGQIVYYKRKNDSMGYNINFPGLQRQFSAICNK